jgi:hypothetical protein
VVGLALRDGDVLQLNPLQSSHFVESLPQLIDSPKSNMDYAEYSKAWFPAL